MNEILKLPVTAAVIGSAITLVVTWTITIFREKKSDLKNLVVRLRIIGNEVSFYRDRMAGLSAELQTMANAVGAVIAAAALGKQAPTLPVQPSYNFYPEVLGESKVELAGMSRNTDLIKDVSYAHFELSHIADKLQMLRARWEKGNLFNQFEQANILGLKKLLDENIVRFDALSEALKFELITQESKLSFFDLLDI